MNGFGKSVNICLAFFSENKLDRLFIKINPYKKKGRQRQGRSCDDIFFRTSLRIG